MLSSTINESHLTANGNNRPDEQWHERQRSKNIRAQSVNRASGPARRHRQNQHTRPELVGIVVGGICWRRSSSGRCGVRGHWSRFGLMGCTHPVVGRARRTCRHRSGHRIHHTRDTISQSEHHCHQTHYKLSKLEQYPTPTDDGNNRREKNATSLSRIGRCRRRAFAKRS